MIAHRFVRFSLVGTLFFVTGIASSRLAWAKAGVPSASSTAASEPPLALYPAQLEAFAELVGEPMASVTLRLSMEPSLIPLAVAAAEVRRERRRSGKVLTIVGFSVLGAGTGAGVAIFISGIAANCTSEMCSSNDGRMQLGLLIVALSQGVGLALGIPGIVRMVRQSDTETEAAARYHAAAMNRTTDRSATPSQSLQPRTLESKLTAMSFVVPLLSAVF
jgi:hypothetical protein